jgi:hypothetical protein
MQPALLYRQHALDIDVYRVESAHRYLGEAHLYAAGWDKRGGLFARCCVAPVSADGQLSTCMPFRRLPDDPSNDPEYIQMLSLGKTSVLAAIKNARWKSEDAKPTGSKSEGESGIEW